MKTAVWFFLVMGTLTAAASASSQTQTPEKFMSEVESQLYELTISSQRTEWVRDNFITEDTEILSAQASERLISTSMQFAKKSMRFAKFRLAPDLDRKFQILRTFFVLATPSNPKEAEQVTRIVSLMEGTYGKGKYCPPGKDHCLNLEDLTRIMAASRDPQELKDVWVGWHKISVPYRKDFINYVKLGNKGARELGFADTGAMWRSKYDMSPKAFDKEVDRLWEQVRPLYVSLHAYVRSKLREKYGNLVPADGPIPAHLLGNMWSQTWENVFPLVAPKNADPGYDLTEILKKRKTDARQMVKYGEHFFTSLGFPSLPATFWERSLFTKPADREVVCHASAEDIDLKNDVRVKMCIDSTADYFSTVHHELGHNYYTLAYQNQPLLFRNGANDGFHEAIGDTIALSVTPEYLVNIGLLGSAPDVSKDIGLLLERALEKIAFLPFGLLVDQWRWKVFSGEIPPDQLNEGWWKLRLKYQGIAPPVERTENDFDPGAKMHVAANVPYMRYFLAQILQFQFHRALAKIADCKVPLHRCSIYDNKEAGRRLRKMLEMGQSRPWPEALEELTGQRQMDAKAMVDYFAPLKEWLDKQNAGKPVGW